eukprot:1161512-Pelagomonas_calceolata.AAC.8
MHNSARTMSSILKLTICSRTPSSLQAVAARHHRMKAPHGLASTKCRRAAPMASRLPAPPPPMGGMPAGYAGQPPPGQYFTPGAYPGASPASPLTQARFGRRASPGEQGVA